MTQPAPSDNLPIHFRSAPLMGVDGHVLAGARLDVMDSTNTYHVKLTNDADGLLPIGNPTELDSVGRIDVYVPVSSVYTAVITYQRDNGQLATLTYLFFAGDPTKATIISKYIKQGETDHSLALQRFFDTGLSLGGGQGIFTDDVSWNFASKVYVDNIPNTPWQCRLYQQSMAQAMIVNPVIQKDANCVMTNASATFTCPTARPEDIGSLIQPESGATNFGFHAGTTVLNVVGTTVTASSTWRGASGPAALRIQRAVINLNTSRSTGVNAGGSNNSPGLILESLWVDTPTDNDNLLGFVQTDGISVYMRNCDTDHLYRPLKSVNTYTDSMRLDEWKYRAAPFTASGSCYQADLYTGTAVMGTGQSSSGSDTWLTVANLTSFRGMPLNIPVPILCTVAPDATTPQITAGVANGNTPDFTGSAIYWGVGTMVGAAGRLRLYTTRQGAMAGTASKQITITTGKSGGSNSQYLYLTTDEDKSNGWLYEQTVAGDGLIVSGGKGGTDTPSVNLKGNKGAVIDGCIGPALRFQSCSGVNVNGYHWDSNQTGGLRSAIVCRDTQMAINGCWSHAGPAKVDQTNQFHLVTVADSNAVGDAYPNSIGSDLAINDWSGSCRYDHTGNGVAAEDFRYPDINLLSMNINSRVRVNRHSYYFNKQGTDADNGHYPDAPLVGSYIDGFYTPANNNSYGDGAAINAAAAKARSILTQSFEIRMNWVSSAPVVTFKPLGVFGVRAETAAGPNPPLITATTSDLLGTLAANTTYNYAVALRNVDGAFGPVSLVSSATTPNDATSDHSNQIGVSIPVDGPQCLGVWRTTGADNVLAGGASSVYIEVPLDCVQTLLRDTGARCNGRNWSTTDVDGTTIKVPNTVAAVDNTWTGTVSPSGLRTIELSAVPSRAAQGPFGVGDRIINNTPAHLGTPGWRCTAPGNGATASFFAEAALT